MLMVSKFLTVTSHGQQIFSPGEIKFSMDFARKGHWSKKLPSIFSIFQLESFIGLCVKIRHRNKSASSKSSPVQSSRSKLTTCPGKEWESLSIFLLNSTAILVSGEQKHLKWSQPKFLAKAVAKWKWFWKPCRGLNRQDKLPSSI